MKFIIFLIFIAGCSSTQPVKKKKIKRKFKLASGKSCISKHRNFEGKNLVTIAQIKSTDLSYCFSNYLKFEKRKNQIIQTCNQLSIGRNGKVNYVQVTDLNKKRLPNDFKMCLKQEYWSMSFKGLSLQKNYVIRFPLTFRSK